MQGNKTLYVKERFLTVFEGEIVRNNILQAVGVFSAKYLHASIEDTANKNMKTDV